MDSLISEKAAAVASVAEYKIAKEAFHSNNLGSSVMSINIISLTALSAYAIYAASTYKRHTSLIIQYATTVLPLLLGITLFAAQPSTFNAVLLCIFGLIFDPKQRAIQDKRHAAGVGRPPAEAAKSKGRWLDESDSDEEPSQPASTSIPAARPPVTLPSEMISASSTATSPNLSVEGSPEGKGSSRRRKRSVSPAGKAHATIDVLETPEMLAKGTMLRQQSGYPSPSQQRAEAASANGKIPFLSVYRAHMMIMTIHCILAVDFPIFPRWAGKCENFGTSLMDVGVGSFVFSLGIVSTRNFTSERQAGRSILQSAKRAIPVFVLGMIRVIMVKGVEYPEHITEYGVHWNFFFTLAVLPFFGALLWPLRQRGLDWTILAALVTVWHQFFLSFTPLQEYILSPFRTGIIGANKEGLASLPGYLAIYLLGLSAGQHILRATDIGRQAKPSSRVTAEQAEEKYRKRRTELALELFGYSVAWWVILAACMIGGMGVSRRLANLPYVLWVAAFNSTFLLGYLLIEIVVVSPYPVSPACPPLLESINTNSLPIFLAANLLTGLVNVSMQTMYAKWYVAISVLGAYSVAVCALAWALEGRRLKL